jgi:hypothetical protein
MPRTIVSRRPAPAESVGVRAATPAKARLEDAGQQLRRDAPTAALDRDDGIATVPAHTHLDLSSGRGVTDRVGHEVVEDA